MSKQTDQDTLDSIDAFSRYAEQFLKVSKREKLLLMDKHGEVFEYQPSEWQKLDWELIKNRINFKLKVQYIRKRPQN
jgi:hypothetical protein